MPSVSRIEVPDGSLLHARQRSGCYADAFALEVPVRVTLAQSVRAFCTTPLFRAERLLLGWFLGRPSTDAQVDALAEGRGDSLTVFRVAARTADEILLTAEGGATSSWLKVAPTTSGTRLLFGSAIERRAVGRDGRPALGRAFRVLMPVHLVYSRALLRATAARLRG